MKESKISGFMQQVLIISFIGLCSAVAAAISPMLPNNPLAGLPSTPGATVAAIAGLGDNEWLCLGVPGPDSVSVAAGREGSARGRAWSASGMVLVPPLRGAFFTGEGVHGFVKTDGYGMDDAWFYDINAHRWICLFPGTNTTQFNQQVADGDIRVDTLGRAVDTGNQPIPGHIYIHVYDWVTYEPNVEKLYLLPGWAPFGRYFMPGLAAISEGLTALESQGLNKSGPIFAPWAYDIRTGKYERGPASADECFGGTSCVGAGGFAVFQYISSKKQCLNFNFYWDGSYFGYFDASTSSWSSIRAPGTPLGGYDFQGCYDSKRDRVYIGNSDDNFCYLDIQTNTWTKISPSPFSDTLIYFPNCGGFLNYDSLNDIILIMDPWYSKAIHPFDPETNTWLPPLPFVCTASSPSSSFYDPLLGVHFVYSAGDSRVDGQSQMWVFKYKRSDSTGVAQGGVRPGGFSLTAHPNPFASSIAIQVTGAAGCVRVGIYDLAGHRVATPAPGSKAGEFLFTPQGLAPGLYLIKAIGRNMQVSGKILLGR